MAGTKACRRGVGGDASSLRDTNAVYMMDRNDASVVCWDRGAREVAWVAATLGQT